MAWIRAIVMIAIGFCSPAFYELDQRTVRFQLRIRNNRIMGSFSRFFFALQIAILSACTLPPATKVVDSCSSSASVAEEDASPQAEAVAIGNAIGQHIQLSEPMSLNRVMLKLQTAGLTAITVNVYEDFANSDTSVSGPPIAQFTISKNVTAAQFEAVWLDLPSTVELEADRDYLIGFSADAAMSVAWADRNRSSIVRTDYRSGNSITNWNPSSAPNKAISMGLGGGQDCVIE